MHVQSVSELSSVRPKNSSYKEQKNAGPHNAQQAGRCAASIFLFFVTLNFAAHYFWGDNKVNCALWDGDGMGGRLPNYPFKENVISARASSNRFPLQLTQVTAVQCVIPPGAANNFLLLFQSN